MAQYKDVEICLEKKHCQHTTKCLQSSFFRNFFRAVVESILLYGSENWTLTSEIVKKLDRAYIRFLLSNLNIKWQDHKTSKDLYENLPKLTDTTKQCRMYFAGHC